jgi:hypothetical protein
MGSRRLLRGLVLRLQPRGGAVFDADEQRHERARRHAILAPDYHLRRRGIDDVLRRFPGRVDPALPAGGGGVRHRRQLEIESLPVGVGHQVQP